MGQTDQLSSVKLNIIDTDREADIGLGTEYPFEAMGQGECTVFKKLSDKLGL